MKRNLHRSAVAVLVLGSAGVQAQDGHMMGGGWYGSGMGGYGGVWIPILLVVIVGLLVWIVMQRRK
jgi:hypothetical protein